MATKADFNAEEWTSVTEGPMLAGLQVVAAERGGTIRESLAVAKAYAAARKEQGASPLLDEIVATPPAMDPKRVKESGGDIKAFATEALSKAVATIDSKGSPEDGKAYKEFVLKVAEAVAGANKEGGFLGFGGTPISANEQAALDEIRSTLGLGAAT